MMMKRWLDKRRSDGSGAELEDVFVGIDESESQLRGALLEVLYSKARLRGELSRQRVLAARALTPERRAILMDLEDELRCVRDLEAVLIDRLKALKRHRTEAEAVARLDRSAELRRNARRLLDHGGSDELVERLRDLREQRTIERELEAL